MTADEIREDYDDKADQNDYYLMEIAAACRTKRDTKTIQRFTFNYCRVG